MANNDNTLVVYARTLLPEEVAYLHAKRALAEARARVVPDSAQNNGNIPVVYARVLLLEEVAYLHSKRALTEAHARVAPGSAQNNDNTPVIHSRALLPKEIRDRLSEIGAPVRAPVDAASGSMWGTGVMEVAWIKVSNVHLDKRSERNMAYVASLMGVPLEIYSATLHRPASARVKVGCRNVDEIPSVAEAVLGEHFYDFYFEVDQVVSVDAERGEFDAGKVEYMMESPDNVVQVEVIPTPPLAIEENLRFSLRNVQSKMDDVQLKAAAAVKKRNAEGILHSHNSFDALSNQNMMLAASKMGVIIPDNDFVNIDVIRELEKFRNNNSKVEREGVVEVEENISNMTLVNANGVVTPLDLSWMEEGNIEEDDFTLVRSRKKNRIKKPVVIARPVTRS
ncbi:hypothetical protein D1007_00613 [Hordeum vulgare]|nr:hypothetical protein D1007_00613 [Hordeum vulgare]